MARIRGRFPSAIALLAVGLVLFAVGAKLALIHRYGTDQPSADQWAADAMEFLHGPRDYPADLGQLVAPQGEHRPALMRLWTRGLIVANAGQWDAYLELVANLLIYGAFLVVAWQWLAREFEGVGLAVVTAFMAVMFALPAAAENFLWGFQSRFLFMLLLGLLHIAGTQGAGRPGGRWWLAQLAGLAGIFTTAAGVMSAAALIVMAGLELLRGRRQEWAGWTLGVNALLLGLGLWLLPMGAAVTGGHWATLTQAIVRTGYLLSWPLPGFWWAFVFQAPWVILLVAWWRNPDRAQAARQARVVAIGLWVAGMAVAIALGRAITPPTISARYYDILLLGLVSNGAGLVLGTTLWTGWRRWTWMVGGLVWLLSVGWGLWNFNQPEKLRAQFEHEHRLAVEQGRIVRDFLVSNDPAKLQEFANSSHRFPHFQTTLDFLRDPRVRPVLPPSLTPDGHAGPLSRLSRLVARGWALFCGLGVVGLIAGALRLERVESKKPPVWYAT